MVDIAEQVQRLEPVLLSYPWRTGAGTVAGGSKSRANQTSAVRLGKHAVSLTSFTTLVLSTATTHTLALSHTYGRNPSVSLSALAISLSFQLPPLSKSHLRACRRQITPLSSMSIRTSVSYRRSDGSLGLDCGYLV
jgi:hypothetical protein